MTRKRMAEKNGAPGALTKRSKLLCLMLLLILVFATSCWDRVEVESLGIVLLTALDKGEEKNLLVTVQIINPKGLAGGGGGGGGGGGMESGGVGKSSAFRHFSEEADTIFNAIRGMAPHSPRELYFAHNQIIIISEELAREGVAGLLDFFDRNPQFRRNNWILISDQGINQTVMLDRPRPLEEVPAQRINRIIMERDRSPDYVISQLGDFMEMMVTPGIEPYSAGIHLFKNPEPPGREHIGSDIEITKTAIFKGDRMVAWFNNRESRGLLWIREGVQGGVIMAPLDGNENVSLEILGSSSSFKPIITEDGRVVVTIDVKAEGNVGEVTNFIDLAKPENVDRLSRLLEREIRTDILQAVNKAQELNTDVLGFGQEVHRRYPGYWRQVGHRWDEFFPQVEVVVNVQAEIPRTGLISRPVQPAN